jgi:hypothetical protein
MASYPNIAFDICGICCGHFLMPFWTFFLATFIGKTIIRNSYQSMIYILLCSEEYLERMIHIVQYLLPDQWHCDEFIRNIIEEGSQSFQQKLHQKHPTNNITTTTTTTATSTICASTLENSSCILDNTPQPHEPLLTTSSSSITSLASTVTSSSSSSTVSNIEMSHPPIAEWLYFSWQCFMTFVLSYFIISCITEFVQYYQHTVDTEQSKQLRMRLPANIIAEIQLPNSDQLRLPPPTPRTRSSSVSSNGSNNSSISNTSNNNNNNNNQKHQLIQENKSNNNNKINQSRKQLEPQSQQQNQQATIIPISESSFVEGKQLFSEDKDELRINQKTTDTNSANSIQ